MYPELGRWVTVGCFVDEASLAGSQAPCDFFESQRQDLVSVRVG